MEFTVKREDVVEEEEAPRKLSEQEQEDRDIELDLDDWVEEEDAVKSLFNDDLLPTVEDILSHDIGLFNFDLKQMVEETCTDDIGVIKLINFIRRSVASAEEGAISVSFAEGLAVEIKTREFLNGDENLKPVLADDPLLYLYEGTIFTAADADA
ncbi:hypothetical protein B484DRAFT_456564 [Ochromonadaceae sp. CCMP2298]|nr:hypothetical protein B484DRAFT_456564 [Ochromonadaceae sp. CCMP2298]|mmetsp:Transcript_6469/g.14278  ORF Transcript_6469/g.14278 Transcript_6469/m.14278 type:complete len:154 (-) Transcript_6469:138-599(-)